MDEERKFNLSVDIKEKKKSGTVLMTEGSIWKKLLIFSVPLILGNLLQQLYSTVDSIIVGNKLARIGRYRRTLYAHTEALYQYKVERYIDN